MNDNADNSNSPKNDYRQRYAGIRAIVLGGTGFIGRWVARELYYSGAELCLPVRDRVAADRILAADNINGDIYEVDFRDAEALGSIYKEFRPAVTFNLAGYGVDRSEQNEELAYQINAGLIETVCDAICEVRDSEWTGQNIVNVGTAMEYGLANGNLAEDSETKPTTLYGKSKLAGTIALAERCGAGAVKGLTARLFSVYGPGESPKRLLPFLIRAAREETAIPLTAGSHLRDFVYVQDVAESLLRLGLTTSGGNVVNVATGELSSVKSFVETAAGILGISPERLVFGALPTREEEMEHEPVTNRRLVELTGSAPGTTIPVGIRKSLAFEDLIANQAAVRGLG